MSAGKGALIGFLVATVLGFVASHTGCEPRSFEDSRYFLVNGVIALFIGLVGAVLGGVVGLITGRK